MCLILLSYRMHPDYPLILAANRDEFYNRPTAPLDWWTDHPDVLAGRDLKHRRDNQLPRTVRTDGKGTFTRPSNSRFSHRKRIAAALS
jgi:uncharacterized protein with NRDE domain